MDFKIGDTVEVGYDVDIDKIRGVVTKIRYRDDSPSCVEIKRASGVHNEYRPNKDGVFDFIQKVGE